MPEYCHIGLILNDKGKKISKRDRAEALREHIKKLIESGQETIGSITEKWNQAIKDE